MDNAKKELMTLPIKYPDYENCLANLACSVLKHFGIEPPNSTYKPADELLAKEYRNIILLLLDGMGTNILEKHLSPDGFFRSHFCGIAFFHYGFARLIRRLVKSH